MRNWLAATIRRGDPKIVTNPSYYEEHADSVELWLPGSPLFPTLAFSVDSLAGTPLRSIRELVSE